MHDTTAQWILELAALGSAAHELEDFYDSADAPPVLAPQGPRLDKDAADFVDGLVEEFLGFMFYTGETAAESAVVHVALAASHSLSRTSLEQRARWLRQSLHVQAMAQPLDGVAPESARYLHLLAEVFEQLASPLPWNAASDVLLHAKPAQPRDGIREMRAQIAALHDASGLDPWTRTLAAESLLWASGWTRTEYDTTDAAVGHFDFELEYQRIEASTRGDRPWGRESARLLLESESLPSWRMPDEF